MLSTEVGLPLPPSAQQSWVFAQLMASIFPEPLERFVPTTGTPIGGGQDEGYKGRPGAGPDEPTAQQSVVLAQEIASKSPLL